MDMDTTETPWMQEDAEQLAEPAELAEDIAAYLQREKEDTVDEVDALADTDLLTDAEGFLVTLTSGAQLMVTVKRHR